MGFLFLDTETAYNSKDYTLKKMSVVEFVRDPRFKVFGVGMAANHDAPLWFSKGFREQTQLCSDVVLVSHNIKFDGFILKEKYGIVPGQYIDTLAMSRAVLGKTVKSHSLEALATHFGLPSKKTMKTDGLTDLTPQQEAELADYCINDVELCREIYKRLAPEFPENQYPVLDQTIRMFVNPKLQLNVPLLEEANGKENKRREDIFKEIGIDKKEFASNKKFPELLKAKGYEIPFKPSPRKVDADGKPLSIPALALGDVEFLALLESENEELKKLCEARVAAKSTLLETRTAKLATIGKTGLWPFDVQYSGAEQTHRFSGGSGAGGNPQNFTRDSALREAVEAPEGYSLVVGDFSNIELRLVAYLSKDAGLIQAIEQNVDIYCDFASAFYGRKITKENDVERRYGKTAILGLGYGMGWKKFIKTVKTQTGQAITEEQAKKTVELYRQRYNGVPRLWEQLDNLIPNLQTCKNGIQYSCSFAVIADHEGFFLPSGLKIRYPNLRQEAGDRGRMEWVYDVYRKGKLEKSKLYGGKILEGICQALAGELTKQAMEEMEETVVGQVHDELIVICKKGTELMTKQKLYRAMTTAPSWLPQIKLEAEVKYGANWAACK